ncbi:MAG TPA: hypothetical protein VMD02_06750, partial [Candidatus Omnitrophota bacterium]|nr:hypothetical protein [Candidatus Omnitrophota bacterium]
MSVLEKGSLAIQNSVRNNLTPVVSRVSTSIWNTSRSGLITYLQGLNLSSAAGSQVIETLKLENIIKTRFQDDVTSLTDLKEYHIRSSVTQRRLGRVLKEIDDNLSRPIGLSMDALNAAGNLTPASASLTASVTDVVWSAREALSKASLWCARTGVITKNLEIRNTETRLTSLLEVLTSLSLDPQTRQGISDGSLTLSADSRETAKLLIGRAETMVAGMEESAYAILFETR